MSKVVKNLKLKNSRTIIIGSIILIVAGLCLLIGTLRLFEPQSEADTPPPIFKVAEPAHIFIGSVEAIAVRKDYLYLGRGPHLTIYDVSNPIQFQFPLIGYVENLTSEQIRDIALIADTLYVASNLGDLYVIDVSTPSEPKQVGIYKVPEPVQTIAVNKTVNRTDDNVDKIIAYVATETGNLYLIDLTDPGHPIELGLYKGLGKVVEVTVISTPNQTTLVYVASGLDGLHILDVSNPALPTEITVHGLPDGVWDIAIEDSRAYFTAGESGLKMMDISDPFQLSEINVQPIVNSVVAVAVVEKVAYIAGKEQGLYLIDVSNPNKPLKLSEQSLVRQATNIIVTEDKAYVTDPGVGLMTFLVEDTEPVIPTSTPVQRNEVCTNTNPMICVDLDWFLP